MPIIVAVDGIMGAGKSTLLKNLESIQSIRTRRLIILQEDVSDWVDKGLLKQYYSDPERYAFVFQLYVLQTRARKLEITIENHADAVIVSERTSFSDYMFALMLHETGKISDLEFKVYQMAYENLKKVQLSARIFLQCSPEKALERCVLRDREGEGNISLEYLQQVEEYMDDFFRPFKGPYLAISSDIDFNYLVETTLMFLEETVHEVDEAVFRNAFLQWSTVLAIVLAFAGSASVLSFLSS